MLMVAREVPPGVPPKLRSGAHLRRIVDLGLDPRLSTQLGQLLLTKQITEALFETGEYIGRTIRAFKYYKGHPSSSAKSPSYGASFATGGAIDPDKWQERYDAAVERHAELANMLRPYPAKPVALTLALCADDQFIGSTLPNDVRAVLLGVGRDLERPKRRGSRMVADVVPISSRKGIGKHTGKGTWRDPDAPKATTELIKEGGE